MDVLPMLTFGDIVVTEDGEIGVCCKFWADGEVEVYLRETDAIVPIRSSELKRYEYSKHIND